MASVPQPARRLRLTILDDNPFVRVDGEIRPVAALFHRFAAAVVAAGPFERADYLVPVRDLAPGESPPELAAVDIDRLRPVPTAPFAGAAGYLRGAPGLIRRNWPVIRAAVEDSDLVWIKAPASNAPLAALACARARVPRFTWVAGSVREVVAGQDRRGLDAVAAATGAVAYDGFTRVLTRTGPAIRLDERVFTSVVSGADVGASAEPTDRPAPQADLVHLAWAGRVRTDKGLDDLLSAVAILRRDGLSVGLDVIGDGPEVRRLQAASAALGLSTEIRWRGYLADRKAYLAALREADIFVLPSRAEGVPKVLVEAMAVGLPVVATAVGRIPTLLGDGARGVLVPPRDPARLAGAIAGLAGDANARARLRAAGLRFASEHTMEAQAERLVTWLRSTLPELAWDGGAGTW